MQKEFIFSGFGGQGIMLVGQLLAYAGIDKDFHATWIPSYGPEMRGGTANCSVILSDEEIGAVVVDEPDVALVFNRPSYIKYEKRVKSSGLLVINSSLVSDDTDRDDIRIVKVPASEIADQFQNRKLTNIVMLGAMLANEPALSISDVERSIVNHLHFKDLSLISLNLKALNQGATFTIER